MGRAFEYRKARKLKRWGNMARVFTRIGREITLAAKAGGPDPDTNPRLRLAIQNAKSENMPKDNVERAIKKATEKDTKDYKELVYEGKGPHGIAIVVETATDNPTRTVANVRSYFTKFGGTLGTTGMLDFLFDRKCSFEVEAKEGVDLEELELELIDFGADEVFADDDSIMIFAEFTGFGPIQKFLEENDYNIKTFRFERIPNDTKELNEEEQADVEKLIEKLEDDDDVTNVFHNMQ
ncbi:YebC/PmpR family DNA-binding transcriptional regulator [Perlabentimonas gracilis]|jgi:YebC/PmpR family DNA-binding regulatory protein|uniref:YebC/PmpR family DNA-binding transcriptional regulator n=1 Tax=Perlabentimonas gracilis TaxID=2715279 RepID=UPI00140B5586|nr:YebC/PmpR family DNA-binding transcriptional regulator [Perlabentimonas gracilis]NHB69552.1 YebC/PmpR family DNA-binding transcriptional regulator [Perlabentimonas gracilis]